MELKASNLHMAVDFQRGTVTSLVIGSRERLAAEAPLFRVCLRGEGGDTLTLTPTDARRCTEEKSGARYTDFSLAGVSVCVTLTEEGGEAP